MYVSNYIFFAEQNRPDSERSGVGWWRRLCQCFIAWLEEPVDFPGKIYPAPPAPNQNSRSREPERD
jgi:hypothetical protein